MTNICLGAGCDIPLHKEGSFWGRTYSGDRNVQEAGLLRVKFPFGIKIKENINARSFITYHGNIPGPKTKKNVSFAVVKNIAIYSCVDLSFCWFIFNTGTFSLSQNMLLIVKESFQAQALIVFDNQKHVL